MINFFKGIADWVLEKLNKEGVKKTIIAIIASVFIVMLLSNHENSIMRKFEQAVFEENAESVEEHKELYLASRDMYAQIKRIMRAQRPVVGADYILYLEYHNGSENIATGYQFCKFDVTIEELSDTVPYIVIDDFKDENLYKYDILLSDQVTKSKVSSFTLEEIAAFDKNMIYTLHPNDHTQQIVFYNITYNNMCAGTLMFMYKAGQEIDYRAIANCGADIETVIINALNEHNSIYSKRNDKRR